MSIRNKIVCYILILIWVIMLVIEIAKIDNTNKKPEQEPQVIIKEVEVEKDPITIFVERDEMDFSKYEKVMLKVNNVEQNPELPTGCEVTALTTVLNYLGYGVDKLTMADTFLPKGEIGKVTPDEAFIGNPRSKYAYGANAPVLVKTANDYLATRKSKYVAYNKTGTEFEDLLKYINDGYPVMVWETINLVKTRPTTKWVIDNKEVQWLANLHCMVLIGYTEDTYIMADPLKQGIVEYDKDLVEQRYNELGKQAIVIY